ncbi:MAG: glycosyltransferase family 1 protein [Arenicellales bacterium]
MTLRRLVDFLRAGGVEVTVVCGARSTSDGSSHPDYIAQVPSVPLPFEPEYRLPGGLTRTVKRTLLANPDTLIHLGAPDTLAVSCLRFARRHGLPVVSSFHSNIVSYFRYLRLPRVLESLGWAYFRWFYGRCDQVYVPTESMRVELERHGVRANYLLWPRGVDRERFSPAHRCEEWRSTHGAAPEDIIVLFVARLKWEKNLKMLCRIIERLHARSPHIRTVIVGEGVAYKHLTQHLPETRFTGRLGGTELAKAYASSDVFLYPSTTDTFGNVTLEAMASGLPAVCADAPGSRNLVRSGQTGYLADPDSVEQFSDCVTRLAEDTALRRRMSRAAVQDSARYDWDSVMHAICGYYDDLYQHRHTGPKH